ncbi:MAG: ABC transporter ATP-binding protein [Bacteroidetes bacterium]|jgi:ABC-2 type transport system ATP-binding protein|nr:ABC transporter ATP-binding protein [Bacteroidota bacterium]MBT6687761.1 ABC transporter ATP-binding protein [Bacteroidota bacterium]MBT7143395.1 ABC transporter ATP-binding protein [Bacteroidota bacterium]MBT7492529.1 ABC transporter ATP-binding protein [Bacteroidota bacterium]
MKLNITELSKTYSNGVRALNDLSLEIGEGMFGLLGPNGSGKSTLMRTIATLQSADAGSIMLDDIDVLKQSDEVKKVLGYLPQEFGVYPRISAQDLLDHYALLKGIIKKKERKESVTNLLEMVNLYQYRKKYVSTFSGGMKQRFGIAIALLGNPKLIIVDEPTAGLDPAERVKFNNLLSDISEEKIVILSTHIVDDISDLCNNMGIINNGKLVVHGKPDLLINEINGKIWTKRIEKAEYSDVSNSFNVIYSHLNSGKPLVHVFDEEHPGDGFDNSPACLEDVYFTALRN